MGHVMFPVIYCFPVTLFHGYPDQGRLRKLAIEVSLRSLL